MKTKKELPLCPVATTVRLIDSKWKLLILRDLLADTRRYSDFQKSIQEISQKVLTQSLKSMVEDGIVIRTAYPEVPPRVEYSLSALGNSLRPVINVMEALGKNYQANYK